MADINTQLCARIMENNIDEVIKLIKKGADISYSNNFPLVYAVNHNHFEIIKLLIDEGTDININRGALLYAACVHNNSETVDLLLNEGIQYYDKNNDIINICIYSDNIDILKSLIQYDIVIVTPHHNIYIEECDMDTTIFDACLILKRNNMLQFFITHYPEIIPENINKSFVHEYDIKKYNFIKMLISKNIIDLPD
jgi:hypothetical protein